MQSLDGRCDYLRSTHKALRAGRHKLHGRLVNYLHRSGENGVFSRESLLRQEETLADLDHSIDDWYGKLELAESRRMRVRQKLLEHVAAAATLAPSPELEPLQQKPDQLMPMVFKVPLKATASPVTPPAVNDLSFFPSSREMCASRPATATRLPVTATQQLTPPGTPEQGGSPTRHARQDIESIQIFADGNVLGIFDSIERAIGNMTDAEYEMC